MPVAVEFITTVDAGSVRTRVELEQAESAVLKPAPLTLNAPGPVNVACESYRRDRIRLILNGREPVDLAIRDGEFCVVAGGRYPVRKPQEEVLAADGQGILHVGLALDGPMTLSLEPG